jgi:serine 3-dehydrogenase (NADP+)
VAMLSGKTAIVAGASTGMGRATALALAAAGCKVLAAARKKDALEDVAREAAALGGELMTQQMDVTETAEVQSAVELATQRFGRVDVLVNSVGTNTPRRLLPDLTDEDWYSVVNTNLNGAYRLTRAVLPQMRSQGGGLIIHVGSVSGRWPDFSGIAYQASKHGLVGLAHATMIEERVNGLRVSVVFPGLCDTPLMKQRKAPPDRDTLSKALRPEDIAAACVFLAGLPESVYVPELVMAPVALQCIGQMIA